MKESRLIELLDEYDSVQYHKINHKIENGDVYRNVGGTDGWHQVWRYCKQFGFIKRLVDNDKIDFDKVMKLGIPCFVRYDNGEIISVHDVDFDRQLIMLLSISDSPIEDLISYLK